MRDRIDIINKKIDLMESYMRLALSEPVLNEFTEFHTKQMTALKEEYIRISAHGLTKENKDKTI